MAAGPELEQDTYARELLTDIGRGHTGASKALWHAKRAVQSGQGGSHDPALVQLAELGKVHEKHRERALHRWAGRQPWRSLLPEVYRFKCTKWLGPRQGVVPAVHHCLLPHEVLGSLGSSGCPDLLAYVLGTAGDWANCWNGLVAGAPVATAQPGAGAAAGGRHRRARVRRARAAPVATAPGGGTGTNVASVATTPSNGGSTVAATTMPSGVHDGCTSVHDGRTTSTAPVATAPGAEEPTLIVPIGIRGDDAGVAAGEKVLVLTWGSLTCHGGPRDSRITFSMVKGSEATRGANVQEELYKVLVWSFQRLAAGKYPAEDHTGQPFNAQLRRELAGHALYTLQGHTVGGRFAEMRSDWKFLKESLRLEQHYGRNNVRHRCAAQKRPGVLHYANFGQDAALRSTRRSHERWAAHQRSRPWCSPLLALPGFNFELVFFDIMHTLDLGVLQVAVPSALYEVTRDQALFAGSTIEARLLTATRQYHDWCDANGIADRAKVLTPKWVQLPHPRVTQLQCKAAAMRSMAYWMRDALYPIRRSSRRALNRWAFFTSRVPVTSSCAGQAATCEPRSAGPWPTAQRQRSSCTAGSTCGPSRGAWRSGSLRPSCTPGRTLHMTMAAPTPATCTATWTRTWWGA